jgi:hypothetical protein
MIEITRARASHFCGIQSARLWKDIEWPGVFDKPSPKWRHFIVDGRVVCPACLNAENWDTLQALAYRNGERLYCRPLDLTRLDKYDDDRFHF